MNFGKVIVVEGWQGPPRMLNERDLCWRFRWEDDPASPIGIRMVDLCDPRGVRVEVWPRDGHVIEPQPDDRFTRGPAVEPTE